jgi:signal transduction histidine kinase
MLGAGLGHDLQNVLLPIQAHLNALAALRNDFATETARERYAQHADAMRSCVAYLRQLADGMHFLSRASSSSSEESTIAEITALRSWWSTVEPLFTAALPREIRFEESFKARCGDVQIDPSVLTQVVLNLVVNARDAVAQRHGIRGQGGEIRVEFGSARLERRRAVRIAVSDNGIGMSAETRARACEVFFTTKPSGRGTGLGLAMVAKAVEEARGKIEITSTLGVGTTIEIALPAAGETAAARDVSASPDASSSQRVKP